MWFFLIVVIFCMCHDFSLEFYIAIWGIVGIGFLWGFFGHWETLGEQWAREAREKREREERREK